MDSIDYYNRYAGMYFENTVDLDMKEILDKFIELLPENGSVLDLGCGSGRDCLYLAEAGYYVTPLDGSKEMCKLAEIHTNMEVLNLTFDEINFDHVFDGIWASASLLHVEEGKIDAVLDRVSRALKSSGILYMSFKYGEREEIRNHRFFHDYTEDSLSSLLLKHGELEVLNIWKTEDYRDETGKMKWVNVLVRKR